MMTWAPLVQLPQPSMEGVYPPSQGTLSNQLEVLNLGQEGEPPGKVDEPWTIQGPESSDLFLVQAPPPALYKVYA